MNIWADDVSTGAAPVFRPLIVLADLERGCSYG